MTNHPRSMRLSKGGVLATERCFAQDGGKRCARRSGHRGQHISGSLMWQDVKLPENWGEGIDVDVEGMFSVIGLRKRVRELEAQLKNCKCKPEAGR